MASRRSGVAGGDGCGVCRRCPEKSSPPPPIAAGSSSQVPHYLYRFIMSESLVAPPVIHAEPAGDHKVTPHAEFLYRVAEKFGLPVVILIMVLWWARTDIVQPLLDAHFDLIKQITAGQREQTQQLGNLGRKLDELISVSSQK